MLRRRLLAAVLPCLWLAAPACAQSNAPQQPIVEFGTSQAIIPAGATDVGFEAVVEGLAERQGDMALFLYPVQDLEFGEGIAVHRSAAPLPGQLGRWRWSLRRTGASPTAICMLSDNSGRDARAAAVRLAQGDLFTLRSGLLTLRMVRTTTGLAGWLLTGTPGSERLISVIAPLAMADASADGAPFHQTPMRATGAATTGPLECRAPVSLGDAFAGQVTVTSVPQLHQIRVSVALQTIRPSVVRQLSLIRLMNEDKTAFESVGLSVSRTLAGAAGTAGSLQMTIQANEAPAGGVVDVFRESERSVLPWAELRWAPLSSQPMPSGMRVQWSVTLQWLPADVPVP